MLDLDAQARALAPHLPVLRPHIRIAQHLHALSALFPVEISSCLLRYDAAVQMARFSDQELTEAEFENAMRAYQEIMSMFVLPRYRFQLTNRWSDFPTTARMKLQILDTVCKVAFCSSRDLRQIM